MLATRSERRALDGALEALVSDRSAPDDGAIAPALEVARSLRDAFTAVVPEAVAARHLEAIGRAQSPSGRHRLVHAPRWRRRTAAALVAAVLVLASGAGTVWAAQSALPGDVLYPVKRASESVRLALARDPGAKARLHLELADRRLEELRALLERRRAGEAVDIGAAMRAFEAEIAGTEADVERGAALGQDLAALVAHVMERIEAHLARLAELRDTQVPPQAREAIQRAIDNAERAKDRVARRGRPEEAGRPDEKPGKGPKQERQERVRGRGKGTTRH